MTERVRFEVRASSLLAAEQYLLPAERYLLPEPCIPDLRGRSGSIKGCPGVTRRTQPTRAPQRVNAGRVVLYTASDVPDLTQDSRLEAELLLTHKQPPPMTSVPVAGSCSLLIIQLRKAVGLSARNGKGDSKTIHGTEASTAGDSVANIL
ncbi:hypothetical protein J6590_034831 [Homalodisca vitripennis]|nr:hypothetical protein J6590_034831 [Homalodisca vitripennis]